MLEDEIQNHAIKVGLYPTVVLTTLHHGRVYNVAHHKKKYEYINNLSHKSQLTYYLVQ